MAFAARPVAAAGQHTAGVTFRNASRMACWRSGTEALVISILWADNIETAVNWLAAGREVRHCYLK